MSKEQLRTASEELAHVSETVNDSTVRERLAEQAAQLEQLADANRGPDHGRLARHKYAISKLRDELDEEQAEHVDHALEEIRAYRETVEGV